MAVETMAGLGFGVHFEGPADVGRIVIVTTAVFRANQHLGSFVRESPPREAGGSCPLCPSCRGNLTDPAGW